MMSYTTILKDTRESGANCLFYVVITYKNYYALRNEEIKLYLPYFAIFVILEENDNSLIVRKTKKQMMFKHMKL